MTSPDQRLIVSSAPFVHVQQSTSSLVSILLICLLPSLGWAIFLFGWQALFTVGVSVVSALIVEGVFCFLRKRPGLSDGTAVLTGVLIGFSMPPSVPLIIPILSAAFAIGVVKWTFGGLGANWMNPAMAGVVFAHVNWPRALVSWKVPRMLAGVDGVTAVTPLSLLKDVAKHSEGMPMDLLRGTGYPATPLDQRVTGYLNDALFSRLGSRLPEGYIDFAVGMRPGTIGEVAGLFLLVASLILIARRVIRWQIPASIALTFGALVRIFGLGVEPLYSGDLLFAFFTGSFLLVIFFSATDPVTSPMSAPAIALYGAGIGALMFLFRRFGSESEGSAYAVIIMNCLVPLLDSLFPASGARKLRPRSAGANA